MQTIRELLNRIRWDANFPGEFEVAFVDHTKPELERVSVGDLRFDPDDSFSFELLDQDGEWVSIPLHRIRRVYRDGELIHYETLPWDGATGGLGYTDWQPPPEEWLPGLYEVQIFVGLTWKVSGTFTVEGEAPTPAPTDTPTKTPIPSRTPTLTRTPRPTGTPTPPRPTRPPYISPTPTLSRTPWPTSNATPTLKPTPWPTLTRTPVTPTITPQPTRTHTPTT